MTEERKNRLINLLIEEFGDPVENRGMLYCLIHAEQLDEIEELIAEYKNT